MSFLDNLKIAYQIGRRAGSQKGISRAALKQLNDEGFGAIGMVLTAGTIIMALYIVILVVGKLREGLPDFTANSSYANATESLDTNAESAFEILGVSPVIVGAVGLLGIVIGGLYAGSR